MDLLGLLGLLFLLFRGRGEEAEAERPPLPPPQARTWPTPPRRRRRTPPVVPASSAPAPPPPWPQVVPSGLPAFPGSGWEYDEPPPKVVQQRAGQLLSTLWARGNGAHKIEQTAGRWVAYRAENVASGKRGVVAYRLKQPRIVPRAPTTAAIPASTRPAPSVPSPPVPTVPTSPKVAPVSVLELPTLRRGMGVRPQSPHPDVRVLQTRLGILADGAFGKDTFAAVQAFQRRKGLDDDGVVGRATWTALFTGAAPAPAPSVRAQV